MEIMLMHKTTPEWEAGAIPSRTLVENVGKTVEGWAKQGLLRAAAGLRASSQGVRLTFENGERRAAPGPFVGNNELIAGFLVIQTRTLDEAIAWSSTLGSAFADIEIDIRPLTEPWDIGLGSKPEDLQTRRYMAAYKATPETEAGPLPSVRKARLQKALESMAEAGVLMSTTALQPSSQAKRLTFKDGEQFVTDGPFTESKELIAGFVTLELDSIDAGVDIARQYGAMIGCHEMDVRVVAR